VKTGFAQLVPIFTPTVLRMTLTVAFLLIKAEEFIKMSVDKGMFIPQEMFLVLISVGS